MAVASADSIAISAVLLVLDSLLILCFSVSIWTEYQPIKFLKARTHSISNEAPVVTAVVASPRNDSITGSSPGGRVLSEKIPGKATSSVPALVSALNRICLLGTVLNLILAIDPGSFLGIFSVSEVLLLIMIQGQVGMTGMTFFFNSWMFILFRDSGMTAESSWKVAVSISTLLYSCTVFFLIASCIVVTLSLDLFYIICTCWLVGYILALFIMISGSSAMTWRVSQILRNKNHRRPLFVKQGIIIASYFPILCMMILCLAADIHSLMILHPEDFDTAWLVAVAAMTIFNYSFALLLIMSLRSGRFARQTEG